MRTIHTLGTSNREIGKFLVILEKFKIKTVVDVRRWPTSKLFPHFQKKNLKKVLEKKGIEYHHFESLGGYRPKGYKNYMKTKEFKKGLEELIKLVKAKETCLVCAEKLPWRCHRLHISRKLTDLGFKMAHLIDQKKVWQPEEENRPLSPKCELKKVI